MLSLSLAKRLAEARYPVPTGLSYEEIEVRAEGLARDYAASCGRRIGRGAGDTEAGDSQPPIFRDLRALKAFIEGHGGTVLQRPSLGVAFDDTPIVVATDRHQFGLYAGHTISGPDAYDLARGLAHMLLHHEVSDRLAMERVLYVPRHDLTPTLRRARQEATVFALALLMPEAEMRMLWERCKDMTAVRGRFWNVSQECVEVRLQRLGLLSSQENTEASAPSP